MDWVRLLRRKGSPINIETLPNDIYSLFDPDTHHDVSEDYLDILCNDLREVLKNRLSKQEVRDNPLRFSSLGKPDRQMWYEAHPDNSKEKMSGKTYLKFLYGDVIEAVLLYLAREAGHEVKDQQAEVEIDGVRGHIDARIDGTLVDIKSASPFGFKKFEDRGIFEDDPFGYVDQLSGYASVLTPGEDAAWVAMEKVSGDVCVTTLPKAVIRHHDPATRIAHQKKVIESETVPDRCYDDVPDGASGNRKLSTGCSYCPHKSRCWPGLRAFAYSTGPRFLTAVAKTPNVPEIDLEKNN